MSTRAVATSKT